MHRRWLIASLAAGALALSGCDYEDWGNSDRFKDDFSMNYPMKKGGRLYLENFNGSVEILGWDQEKIEITGTKYASTEDLLSQVKIDVVSEPENIRIRTIRPGDRGNCGAKYVIRMPNRAVLDRVESSNGSLRVEGVEGAARLKTSNGGITAWGLKGDLDASTSNATVEVGRFEGAAILRTSNGRIKAEGVRGFFEGSTSNGSIDVTLGEMDPAKPIKLNSSNGSINLTLEKFKDNEIRVKTSNSSINLRLPGAVNAQLNASTSSGRIHSDLEVKTTTMSKHRLEGALGSGGALIDLSTSNGNIRILQR